MSSSEQDNKWSNINNRKTSNVQRLTTSRSSSAVSSSRHYHNNTNNTNTKSNSNKTTSEPECLTAQMVPTRNSSDSEVSNLVPSYMEILNTSGQDWLDTYDYSQGEVGIVAVLPEKPPRSNRRTFHQQNNTEKLPIPVRKTKSMRDNTPRTKLRSPPPPPQHPDIFHDQPRLPEKKQSMQFMNKIKRKLSFSKDKKTPSTLMNDRISLPALTREPRRTVSSSVLNHKHQNAPSPPKLPQPLPSPASPLTQSAQLNNINNGLSEYQGYSRHSRHRSFTYSPPPPRTSSLNATEVPAVPPIPTVPKIQALKSKTNSVRKKKSGDSTLSGGSSLIRPTSDNSSSSDQHLMQSTTLTDSKLTSPTLTPIEQAIQLAPSTSAYAMNLTQDLAEIEKDIKELEIQRDRHSSFINTNDLIQKKHESSPPLPKMKSEQHQLVIDQPIQEQTSPLSHSNPQQNVASVVATTTTTTKTIGRKRGKV